MTKQTFLLLLGVVFGFVLPSLGQEFPSLNIIAQSPQAAAYARYGEIPVDYSTGVPSIEIPIHTIDLGDMQIPIKLTYHAAGVKVLDVATEVGLGWSLHIGGNISCQVLGMPDIANSTYPTYRSRQEIRSKIDAVAHDPMLAYQLAKEIWRDVEIHTRTDPATYDALADFHSDRFSFNLSDGESGVFRKDFVNDSIRFIPYSPARVTNLSTGITMVSSKGNTFEFIQANSLYDLYMPSKVTSKEGKVLSYEYNHSNISVVTGLASTLLASEKTLQVHVTPPSPPSWVNNGAHFTSESAFVYRTHVNKLIQRISSDQEEVIFNYANDRLDNLTYRLSNIIVKSKITGEVIKEVDLGHGYFNGEPKLRLDNLVFKALSSELKDNSYQFEYDNSSLPYFPNQSNGWMCSTDYWGYNNYSSKTIAIPSILNSPGFRFYNASTSAARYGDFEPIAQAVPVGILKKIIYPTKGWTSYNYTANAVDGLIGGLRINMIENFDIDGSLIEKKRYIYSNPYYKQIAASDFIFGEITNYAYLNSYATGETYKTRASNNSYFASWGNPNGTNVVFGKVEEIIEGSSSIRGKNEFYYRDQNDDWAFYDGPLVLSANPSLKYSYLTDYGNYRPLLDSNLIYKYEDGLYKPVKALYNKYNVFKQHAYNVGLAIESRIRFRSGTGMNESSVFDMHMGYGGQTLRDRYTQYLYFSNALAYSNKTELVARTVIDYPSGPESDYNQYQESFSYDKKHLFLREKISETSKGEKESTIILYPHDYNVDNGFIKDMLNKNMLAYPLEEVTFVTKSDSLADLVSAKLSTYKEGGKGFLDKVYFVESSAPLSISSFKFSNSTTSGIPFDDPPVGFIPDTRYKEKISVSSYNSLGHPQEIKQQNNIITTYIWGYKGQYPIAKVQNASYDEVASILGTVFINNLNLGHVDAADIQQKMNVLRSHSDMRKAQITSYTYQPLVGMKSMTDWRGFTEYYEYDGFGRLSAIKDDEGNILKTYCYNYAGQRVDCFPTPIVYENVVQRQDFKKNNCSTGQNGSDVTYIVPAGKYTSTVSQEDADAQAQDDIDANGQSFANQYGSCITPNPPASTSTLIFYNNTEQDLPNVSISLWQGTVHIGTYPFPEDGGGTAFYSNIPPGVYRVDTHITVANPSQYTFELPVLGLSGTGNSSFNQVQLVAGGALIVELEF